MSILIEPASLDNQPFTKQGIGANDYVVRVLDQVVGRIVARRVTGGRVVWMWMITGIHLPIQIQPSHGATRTESEAESAFQSKFDSWLEWAKSGNTTVQIGSEDQTSA